MTTGTCEMATIEVNEDLCNMCSLSFPRYEASNELLESLPQMQKVSNIPVFCSTNIVALTLGIHLGIHFKLSRDENL